MSGERRLIYYAALFFILVFWFSSASAYQVCTTGTDAEIKWGTTSTTYYVNTFGGPDNSLSAIQAAMQTWTDVTTSSFVFIYGGTTTSTAYGSNDGINIVTFGPMGTNGTLAENYFWYNSISGQLIDSDIQFNTSYPWATNDSLIAYDVQNVGTHELGHSLCLDDLYDSADSEKTMYGYVSAGETKKRTLDQDDIDGITYLYPASLYISVSPTSYDFGSVIEGSTSAPQIFVISNAGSADLVIGTISLTGTNASEFGIQNDNCSGRTLTPSSNCTFQAVFSPTSGGLKSAMLSIPSDDPDTPLLDVPLSGKGIVPNISVSPTGIDFGNVPVATSSSPQTFTISNTGTGDLTIDTITVAGTNASQFIKQNDNCSGQIIAPSGTCTVQAVFSPTSAGGKSATLTIPSNDSDTPTVNVQLTGTGVLPPTIGYSPTSFSFTTTQEGSNPISQTLSITNTGGGTLHWSVSDDATWLSLSPDSGTDSGTVTLSVDITGLTEGIYDATLTINATDATNSPVNIPVTLNVKPPSAIILLSPNGGEVIPSGAGYMIQWVAPSEAVKFNLKYSVNNGRTWELIAHGVTRTSCAWAVPIPRSNKKQCLVKVIGYDALGQKIGSGISATFTIEVVRLISPDGGEILTSGEQYQYIIWITNITKNPVVKVKLLYTKNGGATWKLIDNLTDPAYLTRVLHSYDLWTVPAVKSANYKCKVKVVLKDGAGNTVGSDVSDSYFTIQPAP